MSPRTALFIAASVAAFIVTVVGTTISQLPTTAFRI